MKKLGIAVGGLLVIVFVVVGIAFLSIDAIAKTAIERGSTYALGVKTTLSKADIGIFSGEFSLTGLDVDNPPGFDQEHFVELGEGKVSVSLGTLRAQIVELPLLALSDITMTLEKKGGRTRGCCGHRVVRAARVVRVARVARDHDPRDCPGPPR